MILFLLCWSADFEMNFYINAGQRLSYSSLICFSYILFLPRYFESVEAGISPTATRCTLAWPKDTSFKWNEQIPCNPSKIDHLWRFVLLRRELICSENEEAVLYGNQWERMGVWKGRQKSTDESSAQFSRREKINQLFVIGYLKRFFCS